MTQTWIDILRVKQWIQIQLGDPRPTALSPLLHVGPVRPTYTSASVHVVICALQAQIGGLQKISYFPTHPLSSTPLDVWWWDLLSRGLPSSPILAGFCPTTTTAKRKRIRRWSIIVPFLKPGLFQQNSIAYENRLLRFPSETWLSLLVARPRFDNWTSANIHIRPKIEFLPSLILSNIYLSACPIKSQSNHCTPIKKTFTSFWQMLFSV